jgi:hypothetical protein
MIKWAAHGDVADVPLCGLVSLFLPNTLPQYTLRYDTRMLWVMASFLSRCPCEQARDSPIQSLSRFIHKLPSPLPMYDTSFCHFLGYHSAITLSDARCPHFFLLHLRSCNNIHDFPSIYQCAKERNRSSMVHSYSVISAYECAPCSKRPPPPNICLSANIAPLAPNPDTRTRTSCRDLRLGSLGSTAEAVVALPKRYLF